MHYQKEEVIPKMRGMWQAALMKLCDIPQLTFNVKHQPCPYCGGKDRFRWTDKINEKGDGGNICNQCGNDSGIGLFMRIRGENYSEAIDTLGEWLNLVPVEVVNKANKAAKRDSGYNFGSQATHEKCVEVMDKTERMEITNLSVFEAFYPLDGESYQVGVKTHDNGYCEHIHAIPCHLVHSDELDDDMCNILFVNEEGQSSFYAKDYTRGSVAVTGKTDKTIYLCVDWIDAQHIHLATGQEVWACFSASNLEIVAYRYKGDRKMRVVCHANDRDTLIAADDRELDVMLPINGKFKNGIERRLYKASDLL
ncbi:DNA primase/helicase [Salmonella phage vB_SenS_UTK0006]|uniref:DNA primase/helicase n=1 Tax=Salmonella phage vB_SenS_UTK0006 TaxID=3028904 RepID=A0AAE9ZF90_9CAUD|nr:DNA primase/helicase [Salmonella phage vB_SenS_UTK0006]